MSVEKWWNEICGGENGRNPEKNLPRTRFVHHETHMEWPRRKLGTPAVGGERLSACAMRPPSWFKSQNLPSCYATVNWIKLRLLQIWSTRLNREVGRKSESCFRILSIKLLSLHYSPFIFGMDISTMSQQELYNSNSIVASSKVKRSGMSENRKKFVIKKISSSFLMSKYQTKMEGVTEQH